MIIGHTKARNFSNHEYFNQECMTLYFGQETSRITCVCQCGCVSLALINNGTNAYEFMLFGILLRFDKSSEGVRRGDSLVVSYKSTRSLLWDAVIVIIYNNSLLCASENIYAGTFYLCKINCVQLLHYAFVKLIVCSCDYILL